MTGQLAWFQRLPEIPDVLGSMNTDRIDSQTVERLFPVRERSLYSPSFSWHCAVSNLCHRVVVNL